jgi:AcrR family transcriptional regulator
VPALTDKGRATRERIVAAAADLFRAHGVSAVSIESVRAAAGVSGSQVSHYFGTRVNLIRAVIDWHVDKIVLDLTRAGPVGGWPAGLSGRHGARECAHECSFCALAAELGERDEQLRAALADGYRRWAECLSQDLADGQRARRDCDEMALAVLAAHQGGSLLSHILGDPAAVTTSLHAALAAIRRSKRPATSPAGRRRGAPRPRSRPRRE